MCLKTKQWITLSHIWRQYDFIVKDLLRRAMIASKEGHVRGWTTEGGVVLSQLDRLPKVTNGVAIIVTKSHIIK